MGLSSKKKEVVIKELTSEIEIKIEELSEKGNRFEEQGQFEDAIQAWQEGLDLIPEPQQLYSEGVWFLASIGEIYFQRGMYSQAQECFDKARKNLSGDGYSNPFVMLRLGECCLEMGDEKDALEYLLRAYMFEGKDIFEPDEEGKDDGMKYYTFLSTHIDLGDENDEGLNVAIVKYNNSIPQV